MNRKLYKGLGVLEGMAKIHWSQWMGIIPFLLLIGLLFFGFITTLNPIILNLIFVTVLLLIYFSTSIFGMKLFEYGEKDIKRDDIEILKLEKEHSALILAIVSGIGIAFLIPGLQRISENPLTALIGLGLLSLGNLIYEMFYYPRYALLIRKRKIEIDLKRKNEI